MSELSTYCLANYPDAWLNETDILVFLVTPSFVFDPDKDVSEYADQVATIVAQSAANLSGRTDASGVADAADITIAITVPTTVDRVVIVQNGGVDDQVIGVFDINPVTLVAGVDMTVVWDDGASKIFDIDGPTFGIPTLVSQQCADPEAMGALAGGVPDFLPALDPGSTFVAAAGNPEDADTPGGWTETHDSGAATDRVAVAFATFAPPGAIAESHLHIFGDYTVTKVGSPTGGTGNAIVVVWTDVGGTETVVGAPMSAYSLSAADAESTESGAFNLAVTIPAGTYDAIGYLVTVSDRNGDDTTADGWTHEISNTESFLCTTYLEVADGSLAGGFVTSPVNVGDAWQFDVTVTYADTDVPSITATWDPDLGSLAAVEVEGDALGSVSSGDDIDISAYASPVAVSLTGITTGVDAAADLTVDLTG